MGCEQLSVGGEVANRVTILRTVMLCGVGWQVAEVREWNAEVAADHATRLAEFDQFRADLKAWHDQCNALTARRHELEAREKDRYGELVKPGLGFKCEL